MLPKLQITVSVPKPCEDRLLKRQTMFVPKANLPQAVVADESGP